ncbi:unnamed protein product [Owenia fusiformis]|uniref:PNT domain-containing protein n=1 Tax=Owenia fusiformis TaxID=6347 RepID=A0A8S4PTK9_OWEFU|nr:unnamed protein product [Owenia fusiformis]
MKKSPHGRIPPAITITPTLEKEATEMQSIPTLKHTPGLLTPGTKRKHEDDIDDFDYAKYKFKKKWAMKVQREKQLAAQMCLGSTEDTPPPTPTSPGYTCSTIGGTNTPSSSPLPSTVFKFDFMKNGFDSTPSTPLSIDSNRTSSPCNRISSPSMRLHSPGYRTLSPGPRSATFPQSKRTVSPTTRPMSARLSPEKTLGMRYRAPPSVFTFDNAPTYMYRTLPISSFSSTIPTFPSASTSSTSNIFRSVTELSKSHCQTQNNDAKLHQANQRISQSNGCIDLTMPKTIDQSKERFEAQEDVPIDYSIKSSGAPERQVDCKFVAQSLPVHSSSNSGNDDLRLFITDLPKDPRDWSRQDVGNWLKYMKYCRGIQGIKEERFPMNGKGICLMDLNMFQYRVPQGGQMLYRDFEMRLCAAVNGVH